MELIWYDYGVFVWPVVCLIFGSVGVIHVVRFFKYGGQFKISMFLMAIIGIPLFALYLFQYFWIVNFQVLANGLGSSYYAERIQNNIEKE